MKIALLTDTHWGVRNDTPIFIENNKKFLDNVFFPELESQGIDTLIHLGDLVDRRKYININTAERLRVDFLQQLVDRNIKLHIIAGNHDTYFKNTNEVNCLRQILPNCYLDTLYDMHSKEVVFDGVPILFMPWICDENRKQIMGKVKKTNAQMAVGHLELSGFEMQKGMVMDHGDNPDDFRKFDLLMSGHYHHRSFNGHVYYLGAHSEFTWSDYADPRGFHVLETTDRSVKFYPNPYRVFDKFFYDDREQDMQKTVFDVDYSKYKNMVVKLVVKNKDNPYWFDMVVENLEKAGVVDMQIVDDHLNLNVEEDADIVSEAEDTVSIFKSFIKQIPATGIDKDKLNNVVLNLYNEALYVE